MSRVITAPEESVGSWSAEIRVVPDPTIFGTVLSFDADSTHSATVTHHNTALSDTVGGAITAWAATGLERWRLLYYGVTVYLDAPALADQGSVVAAQYPVRPLGFTGIGSGAGLLIGAHHIARYQASDTPGFETLHQMPNAFAGKAKDGCYMPLKLDASHSEWHDATDLVYDGSVWATSAGGDLVVPGVVAATSGLYAGLNCGAYAAATWAGQLHYMPLQTNVGTIALSGMSLNATVRVVYRVGIEAMAQPGTNFAPFMKAAPGFDALAIDTYYRIARELKDAYPADHNDLGKLWSVIKNVASKLAPIALPLLGPAGPLVKTAAELVAPMIDKAVEKRKASKALKKK